MKTFDEIKKNPRLRIESVSKDGFSGIVTFSLWNGSIVCSKGAGWEHVSVAPFQRRFVPTWDNMCSIKDMIWNDNEQVIQIHPAKAEYVNNVPNCLHLWRCTYKDMVLPPSVLVGIRKGQTMEQIKTELKEAFEIAGEVYN